MKEIGSYGITCQKCTLNFPYRNRTMYIGEARSQILLCSVEILNLPVAGTQLLKLQRNLTCLAIDEAFGIPPPLPPPPQKKNVNNLSFRGLDRGGEGDRVHCFLKVARPTFHSFDYILRVWKGGF